MLAKRQVPDVDLVVEGDTCSTIDMETWPDEVMFGSWFEEYAAHNFMHVVD